MTRTLTPSLLEDLRKAALHPRRSERLVPMGSLEEDLARAVQKWELKEGFLENEDGVKIDIEDFFWVRLRKVGIRDYAQIGLLSYQFRIHSLICPALGKGFTDHINQDKLDNRRSNLRIATISQSNINKPCNVEKTSKYRGVSKWICNMNGGKYSYTYWRATLSIGYKQVVLGLRKTELEAAILYNEQAPIYHGEFAQLNVIP